MSDYERVKRWREGKKKPCKNCKKVIHGDSAFCRSCAQTNKAKDMSLEEAIYWHSNKESAFALVRSRTKITVRGEKKICESCGYNKHVEVCHIKPVKSFPLDTLISTINERSNLKILCPNCHWELDNNWLYGEKDITTVF
jgi:RNA polymerase subunit RPABC4/transcription elongation factor Spt4